MCARILTRFVTLHFMMALLLLGLVGCRPVFEDQETCATRADCFSDQICTDGVCVVGEPPVEFEDVKIVRFGASTADAELDDEVTLTWEMSDAKSAIISSDSDFSFTIPQEDLESGSTTLSMSQTVTLTLTALGAAEGDESTSTTKINLREIVIPVIEPVIETFAASSTLIEPLNTVTLSWTLVDVDRAELSDGVTTTPLEDTDLQSGTLDVTPENSTNYTLTAYNEDRMTSRSVQIVVQGQPPTITLFASSALRVEQGTDVTLSWDVAGATELAIEDESGGMLDVTGLMLNMDSITQTIPGNKTYTLTASNASGEVSETVAIVAYESLDISAFTATPDLVAAGDQTVLAWTILGNPSAITITAEGDPTPIDLMGASPAGGSLPVTINAAVTYTLTAQNNDGDELSAMVSVDVLPPLPEIQLFDPSDTFVTAGSTVTLNWQVIGATMLTLQDELGTMTDLTGKMTDTDFVDVVVDADHTYTLTATNAAGSDTASVLIAVGEPVTAMLSSNLAMVGVGDDVVLSWVTTNANSITLTSSLGETIDVSGSTVAADSVTVAPAADVTYTLTAQGFAGPVMSTVMVSVTPIARINSFTASSNLIVAGNPVMLSWDIENATSYTLSATDSVGTTTIDTSTKGDVDTLMLTPTETTTYRLEALGALGSMDMVDVTVVVEMPPTIDSFTATPDTLDLTAGPTTSQLAWTSSNTTQFTLLDLGSGLPVMFTDLGNGAGQVDVMPTTTTTYLLNVGNAQGTFVSQMLTVTVNP